MVKNHETYAIPNKEAEIGGTSFREYLDISYAELVFTFGKPNMEDDGYKVDANWVLDTPDGIATIYNYKTGKNYLGKEGKATTDITNWHIGGKSMDVVQHVMRALDLHKEKFIEFIIFDYKEYDAVINEMCNLSMEHKEKLYFQLVNSKDDNYIVAYSNYSMKDSEAHDALHGYMLEESENERCKECGEDGTFTDYICDACYRKIN